MRKLNLRASKVQEGYKELPVSVVDDIVRVLEQVCGSTVSCVTECSNSGVSYFSSKGNIRENLTQQLTYSFVDTKLNSLLLTVCCYEYYRDTSFQVVDRGIVCVNDLLLRALLVSLCKASKKMGADRFVISTGNVAFQSVCGSIFQVTPWKGTYSVRADVVTIAILEADLGV